MQSQIHGKERPKTEYEHKFNQVTSVGHLGKNKPMNFGFPLPGVEQGRSDKFDKFGMDSLDVLFTGTLSFLNAKKLGGEAIGDEDKRRSSALEENGAAKKLEEGRRRKQSITKKPEMLGLDVSQILPQFPHITNTLQSIEKHEVFETMKVYGGARDKISVRNGD